MKYWYTTDHDSIWPVGCASIVSAPTKEEARRLLDAALKESNLRPEEGYTLFELEPNTAKVLLTGDY